MALIRDDEGNFVDSITGRYPLDANGQDVVSNVLPSASDNAPASDPVLASGTKKTGLESVKDWFSNVNNDVSLLKGLVGAGVSIADSVKGKPQVKPNTIPIHPITPPKDPNLIFGMSKPLFFGLLGGIVLIAGTGIYFAVKGGSDSAAPAAK